MADSIRRARQKLRVKREGIFNVFDVNTGEELTKTRAAALALDAAERAEAAESLTPAEGNVTKKRRILRDN